MQINLACHTQQPKDIKIKFLHQRSQTIKQKYNNEHETEYLHHEKAQFHSHTSSPFLHLVYLGAILPNVRATTGDNIPNSKKIKTII